MTSPAPASSRLSEKPIARWERLIVALDVPTPDQARALVRELGESVHFYKLGLELFLTDGYFPLLAELIGQGKKVFADLKFFDVPETVAAAVRQMRGRGVSFLTVHGNQRILEAACREKGDLGILGVTVLTSFDREDLRDLGFPTPISVEDLVLSRAKRALSAGCDGVISSGLEAKRLRDQLGARLLVVSPGIRPFENRLADDHKRVMTDREAFLAGADYVVVGRPIRNAPRPREAAERIQTTIAELFPA
ncbi:MAG TPA: orotidine-5'-phosphate decarboxylase [Myxococcota bacterium]|nr:orotidine-5'-phosphate decarboxylase [Myxococcota bacterium]